MASLKSCTVSIFLSFFTNNWISVRLAFTVIGLVFFYLFFGGLVKTPSHGDNILELLCKYKVEKVSVKCLKIMSGNTKRDKKLVKREIIFYDIWIFGSSKREEKESKSESVRLLADIVKAELNMAMLLCFFLLSLKHLPVMKFDKLLTVLIANMLKWV